MALTEQFANKEKMILFGGLFGVFASVSALCNRCDSTSSVATLSDTTHLQLSKSRSEDLEARLPPAMAGILYHGDGLPLDGTRPFSLLRQS